MAECYRNSFRNVKAHTRHLFLRPDGAEWAECYRNSISERKSKHPTFIFASYGAEWAECYRNSFRNVRANTRHLFLRPTELNG